MDKFPLMQGGVSVGELITEQEALYTWFEARCRLPGEGLWCGFVMGFLVMMVLDVALGG